MITEVCPFCDCEVELEEVFERQTCPNCGKKICPCTMCDPDKCKCSECPLKK